MIYDIRVKKVTKFGINSDLLQKSKEYNINLFSTLEEIIKEKVETRKIKSWQGGKQRVHRII